MDVISLIMCVCVILLTVCILVWIFTGWLYNVDDTKKQIKRLRDCYEIVIIPKDADYSYFDGQDEIFVERVKYVKNEEER